MDVVKIIRVNGVKIIVTKNRCAPGSLNSFYKDEHYWFRNYDIDFQGTMYSI